MVKLGSLNLAGLETFFFLLAAQKCPSASRDAPCPSPPIAGQLHSLPHIPSRGSMFQLEPYRRGYPSPNTGATVTFALPVTRLSVVNLCVMFARNRHRHRIASLACRRFRPWRACRSHALRCGAGLVSSARSVCGMRALASGKSGQDKGEGIFSTTYSSRRRSTASIFRNWSVRTPRPLPTSARRPVARCATTLYIAPCRDHPVLALSRFGKSPYDPRTEGTSQGFTSGSNCIKTTVNCVGLVLPSVEQIHSTSRLLAGPAYPL